jgi:hypothetical protein
MADYNYEQILKDVVNTGYKIDETDKTQSLIS